MHRLSDAEDMQATNHVLKLTVSLLSLCCVHWFCREGGQLTSDEMAHQQRRHQDANL